MKWRIEKVRVKDVEVIKIVLSGMLEPAELPTLISTIMEEVTRSAETNTIVISGRLPVWAFAFIALAVTAARKNVAIADPKLAGAILLQGDVIPLPPEAF